MNDIKTISVITPCYNAAWGIGATMQSILSQTVLRTNKLKLQYIIVDGGSTDGTLDIVHAMRKNFAYGQIIVISEKDQGMYDALAKGLKVATGDYCAYLNAGDFYYSHAFDVVDEILSNHAKVKWLTGLCIIYNEKGHIIDISYPYRYRNTFIQAGWYGPRLPWIQQESTFWKTELNQSLDLTKLVSYQYAGDAYLWKQFSQHTSLHIAYTYLGGFRKHTGQLSINIETYFEEQQREAISLSWYHKILALIERWIWKYARPKTKKKWNHKDIFMYDHAQSIWR